jgi:hypothetical protein
MIYAKLCVGSRQFICFFGTSEWGLSRRDQFETSFVYLYDMLKEQHMVEHYVSAFQEAISEVEAVLGLAAPGTKQRLLEQEAAREEAEDAAWEARGDGDTRGTTLEERKRRERRRQKKKMVPKEGPRKQKQAKNQQQVQKQQQVQQQRQSGGKEGEHAVNEEDEEDKEEKEGDEDEEQPEKVYEEEAGKDVEHGLQKVMRVRKVKCYAEDSDSNGDNSGNDEDYVDDDHGQESGEDSDEEYADEDVVSEVLTDYRPELLVVRMCW